MQLCDIYMSAYVDIHNKIDIILMYYFASNVK